MLSDQEDSSDSDHDNDLKINIKYAENYEKVKRQQELRNNKDFLKSNADDDDESESDSESEDDDGIALSTSLDLEIMKTIESIRNKDPKIYDKKTKWYSSDHSDQESEEDEKKDSKKGSKKKTFKDVIREQLLSTENASDENAANSKLSTLQYDREQEELRKQFLSSANQLSDDSESDAESKGSDDDDLLVAVKKNPKVVAQEEQELLQVISKFEQDEKATAEDLFLANYMKQKKWVDSLSQTLKTTKSKGSEKFMSPEVEDELLDLEEDEQDLVEIDQFESKYNFRFEELQNETAKNATGGVLGHSREVAGSLRRVDDTRKKQREARKERKEAERKKKEEELRRLKNLKRKEIEDRLQEIEKVVGKGFKNNSNLSELLDEDWDPEKYEREMASQFNDDYYAQEDDEFGPPPDISDLLEDGDEYPGEEEEEGEEEKQGEEEFEEAEDGENYEKQIEEALYQYDYEDLVGGMPCRFKYRQVEKEDYGLTVDDILDADDAELNKLVGLKSIVGYSEGQGGVGVGGSYQEDEGYGGRGNGSLSMSDRQLKKQKKFEKKRKALLKSLAEKRKEQEAALAAATRSSAVAKTEAKAKDTSALPPTSVSETKKRKRRRKSGTKGAAEEEEEGGTRESNEVEGQIEMVLESVQQEDSKKKRKERKTKPISAAKKRLDLYS